jgi:hypothetical protein
MPRPTPIHTTADFGHDIALDEMRVAPFELVRER